MADNTNQAAAANASAEVPAKGAVRLRTPLTARFKVDDKTTITPKFQEFSATQAKKIQEAAKANGVQLIVDTDEK